MPNFIDADYDSVLDLARRWRAGARLVSLGGFGRLRRKVASFFDDERLQRVFTFQSLYAGVAPYEALALYAVITYMDTIEGVFVPDGGMHAMAAGLADALHAAGVELRFDADVRRILRAGGGAVNGVELSGGERIRADAIVCNADLPVAYRTLLDDVDAPRVARRGRYSPSCLLWVAGVRGLPPRPAAHHNIHFGRQWDESFRALIRDGELMSDPSILVTLHSLDDASLAPPGCSTIYALEPVPNLDGRVDWTTRRDEAADRLRSQRRRGWLPDRRRDRGGLRPARLGSDGYGARHAVRPRPHVPPDRPVPAAQRGSSCSRPRLRGFVDRARCRGPDGPRLGQVGCGAGAPPRRWACIVITLEASYAECKRLNKRYGTTYYWSTMLLPSVKRPHVHALYGFCRHADDIVDNIVDETSVTSASSAGAPHSPSCAPGSSATSTAGTPTTSSSKPSFTPCGRSTSIRTGSPVSCARWRWI